MASVLGCSSAGEVVVGYDVASLRYEPTAHVVRLGLEGRFAITDRWSFSGEIAAVPFAAIRNGDSHLLRQDPADLGPAPMSSPPPSTPLAARPSCSSTTRSRPTSKSASAYATGGWRRKGRRTFGPDLRQRGRLNKFDLQRYGVLVQAKGKF